MDKHMEALKNVNFTRANLNGKVHEVRRCANITGLTISEKEKVQEAATLFEVAYRMLEEVVQPYTDVLQKDGL